MYLKSIKLQEIVSAFKAFDNQKVMIIGDIMVDAYIWGSVDRISPEAPVPVLNSSKSESRLGGAANVALNIKALGAEPIICSVVGNDDTGKVIKELFYSKNGISTDYILLDDSRITTKKTRIISQSQQIMRIDKEDDAPLNTSIEATLIKTIKSNLEKGNIQAVIFEDYDKGVITSKLIDEITNYCKQLGIMSLCDPKHRNFLDYKNLTVFKPNFKEFCMGINEVVGKDDFDLLQQKAEEFRNEKNFENLIITLSEYGVLYNGALKGVIAAQKRDISDVSGAGDTVISVLTMCMCNGINLATASEIANIAGGLVCEKSGIVPIDKKQLLEECKRLI